MGTIFTKIIVSIKMCINQRLEISDLENKLSRVTKYYLFKK